MAVGVAVRIIRSLISGWRCPGHDDAKRSSFMTDRKFWLSILLIFVALAVLVAIPVLGFRP
jgi:hypothetical protein